MPISKAQVRHIGHLARLRLDETEIEKLSRELSAIIAYVVRLQEVNTEGMDIQARLGEEENVFREDEIRPSPATKDVLGRAPGGGEEYFHVPRVIG
jgi:aspartyl-tRNA(Asn)/glutamyl-tRNA(Gln) amidotransferase subunit C